MSNLFSDAKTIQELIYQTVGAGSVCWSDVEKAGVFDTEKANATAIDSLKRLLELLNVTEFNTNSEDQNLSVEFVSFIRKPFRVEAVEITRENIEELSEMIGELKEGENGPYIEADSNKVPIVNNVFPGYWLVKMGKNYRCFSSKAFKDQFSEMTPSLDRFIRKLNNKPKVSKNV